MNHLEGHYWANFLEHGTPEPPYVALIVSGGHTMLVHVPELFRHEVLGQTLDDAAGEAFDKVARLLGLGFPGGPALDAAARDGDPDAIRFPRAMEDSGDLDFSMSGLKTAVLRHVKAERAAGRDIDVPDLAASFQEAIVDVQVTKTIEAARRTRRRATVLLGGGVVANTRLRERLVADGARGRPRGARPAARAVHGQRGDGRVRGRRPPRTRGPHGVGHRGRPEPTLGAVTTVLVTGGAGFIGSQPGRSPPGRGPPRDRGRRPVHAAASRTSADARGYGKAFTFFNMDVRADGLLSLFERHRPEIVFHLAAQSGVRPSLEDPVHDASINLMGTLNVLECAVKVEARKVIYAASGGTIYGEPKRLPAKESAAQGSHPAQPLRHLEEGGRWTTWASTSATAGWTSRRCALGQRLRAAAGPATARPA